MTTMLYGNLYIKYIHIFFNRHCNEKLLLETILQSNIGRHYYQQLFAALLVQHHNADTLKYI